MQCWCLLSLLESKTQGKCKGNVGVCCHCRRGRHKVKIKLKGNETWINTGDLKMCICKLTVCGTWHLKCITLGMTYFFCFGNFVESRLKVVDAIMYKWFFVCMYVCAWKYICMNVCTYVCAWMYVCMHVCMYDLYECVSVCLFVWMYVTVDNLMRQDRTVEVEVGPTSQYKHSANFLEDSNTREKSSHCRGKARYEVIVDDEVNIPWG